jgi:hypothetical protein
VIRQICAQSLHLPGLSASSALAQLLAHTVALDLEETEDSEGNNCSSCMSSATSSATSSSISVVSVPLEVTGDGPVISLGEVIWRPLGDKLSSIEYGRRLEASPELRADLQLINHTDRGWC